MNELYATSQEIKWLEENHLLAATLRVEPLGEYQAKLSGDNGTIQLTKRALNESGPNKIIASRETQND